MIYHKVYRVINVKSPTDAYRLTIVRVLKMLASFACIMFTMDKEKSVDWHCKLVSKFCLY